jgi:hypothetical protein
VEKTSVYLSADIRRRLSWIAEREGISQAEVIRRAIDSYTPVRHDREFVGARTGDGPGTSIAVVRDEELLEGFGE